MKRKHMNHIQDIIRRLQLGESERRIAKDMQIGRAIVHKYHEIAKEKGYLEKIEAQPSNGELREALGPGVQVPTGIDGRAIPGKHTRLVETRSGDDRHLGTAACRSGYSVRYLHTARFLLTLHHARQEGSYLQYLRSLSRIDVLILEDWMRDPIQISSAQDLLEVFDDRFGRSATIIASQVPISDWHARFPDPTLADAILDRSIHNAYRISLQGDSQRKIRGFRTISHT